MPVAGYKCLVRRAGTATATTLETLTLISGSTFQIADATKRAIDPRVAFSITNGGQTISYADITSAVWEFGEFTFASVPSATVLFNGSFLPMTTSAEIITEAKSFTLTESSEMLDNTVFTSTNPFRQRVYGLADASVSVEMLLNTTDMPSLATLYTQGAMCMLEINSGSSPLFRGYGKIESLERSASVDGLVEVSLNWVLAAERESLTSLIAGYSIRNSLSA